MIIFFRKSGWPVSLVVIGKESVFLPKSFCLFIKGNVGVFAAGTLIEDRFRKFDFDDFGVEKFRKYIGVPVVINQNIVKFRNLIARAF